MDGLFKIFGGGPFEQPPNPETQVLADTTMRKVASVKADIGELRQAIDKLSLITRALWEIIAKSQGLSDEDLVNKVNEIDLRDGALDGKMKQAVKKCVSCGRVLPVRRQKCIYCGVENPGANPFQSINMESIDGSAQGIV